MKPIYGFLVEPLDGKRYDNERDYGSAKLVISASIEDHTVTQRQAKLIATPTWYSGDMKPGDTVIVHHNTFRKSYDMKGREVSGGSFISGNLFVVEKDLLYMYKSGGEGSWKAIHPFIFISPVNNDSNDLFDPSMYKQLWGIVEYSPVPDFSTGDMVSFQPDCEYEFRIDDRTMYRMYTRNLTLIESSHGQSINNLSQEKSMRGWAYSRS